MYGKCYMTMKINKKSKDYKLCIIQAKKNYAFIIDGSVNTMNIIETKWFIRNLKFALKRYLLTNGAKEATEKAVNYVIEKFKKYYDTIPLISMLLYKKENNKLSVLTLNSAKCLVKENEIESVYDKKILKNKRPELYHDITDFNSYIYKEFLYEKTNSIFMFNEGFINYQKYLSLKDEDFYDLVERQGLKYCYNHLNHIEKNDITKNKLSRLKEIDDVAAIFKKLL